MSKVVVSQFVSLDGVMEDPAGNEGSGLGPWTFGFDRGTEGDQFKLDEVMASDALLLGRVTYQGFAEAWPSRDGEFADKFNGMRKYVVSTTLEEAEWNNSTLIKDNVAEEISQLKQGSGGDILVNGSCQLVQTLLEHDLADEYRLMVFRSFSETESGCLRTGAPSRSCGLWTRSRSVRTASSSSPTSPQESERTDRTPVAVAAMERGGCEAGRRDDRRSV